MLLAISKQHPTQIQKNNTTTAKKKQFSNGDINYLDFCFACKPILFHSKQLFRID
jgi:hypothetical protein